jgi:predicted secreted hydrolase
MCSRSVATGARLCLAGLIAFGIPAMPGGDALANGDGASTGARTEFWRMSGRLSAPGGRAFDYAATFFRFALASGTALYPATVSILDESNGVHLHERRTERGAPGLAGAANTRLAVHVGDWSLTETAAPRAARTFELAVRVAGATLRLRGIAEKARIEFPDDGGHGHFAYTSIASSGRLDLPEGRFAVAGKSWLDRETGNAAAPGNGSRVGRYRVQLDDGREILVETSEDAAGGERERQAYLVRRDGTLEKLAPSHYEFVNHLKTTWLSTHTRARYPDLWALHVDGETEAMALEPIAIDQEATGSGDGQSFWDGAVDVYDVTPGSQGQRLGSGYVLLAGYRTEGAR